MAKQPTLAEVLAKADANNRSDAYKSQLTKAYERKYAPKPTSEASGSTAEGKEVPSLEEVLRRADENGKSEGYKKRLTEAYYKKNPGKRPLDFLGDEVPEVEGDVEGVEVVPFEVLIDNYQPPEINDENIDVDNIAGTLELIQENGLNTLKESLANDPKIQEVVEKVESDMNADALAFQEKLSKKYNLADPKEFEQAQTELAEWYDGEFNRRAHEDETYARHMEIYADEFNGYVQDNSARLGARVNEQRIEENRQIVRDNIPIANKWMFDIPIFGDLAWEFSANLGLAIEHSIPTLVEGTENVNYARKLETTNKLRDTYANATEPIPFVVDADGKPLTPADERGLGFWSKSEGVRVVDIDPEVAREWLKSNENETKARLVGNFASTAEHERVMSQLSAPAKFTDFEGNIKWNQIFNAKNIARLSGDQGPMMAAALIPGGSVVLEMGELMNDMTRAVAAKQFGIDEGSVTEDQLLYVLEKGLVDTDTVIDRGLVAGGMDLLAAGKVAKVTTSFYKSLLRSGRKGIMKNGFKHGINYVASTTLEGGTEWGQGYVKQSAVEQATGRPINYHNLKEEGIAGLVFSGFLPLPGAAINTSAAIHQRTVEGLTKMFAEVVQGSANYADVIHHKDAILRPFIEEQVESGEMTREEADVVISDIESTLAAAQEIPPNLSPKDKKAIIPIVKEINEIKEEIKGQNTVFVTREKEKIKALEEKLAAKAAQATYVKDEADFQSQGLEDVIAGEDPITDLFGPLQDTTSPVKVVVSGAERAQEARVVAAAEKKSANADKIVVADELRKQRKERREKLNTISTRDLDILDEKIAINEATLEILTGKKRKTLQEKADKENIKRGIDPHDGLAPPDVNLSQEERRAELEKELAGKVTTDPGFTGTPEGKAKLAEYHKLNNELFYKSTRADRTASIKQDKKHGTDKTRGGRDHQKRDRKRTETRESRDTTSLGVGSYAEGTTEHRLTTEDLYNRDPSKVKGHKEFYKKGMEILEADSSVILVSNPADFAREVAKNKESTGPFKGVANDIVLYEAAQAAASNFGVQIKLTDGRSIISASEKKSKADTPVHELTHHKYEESWSRFIPQLEHSKIGKLEHKRVTTANKYEKGHPLYKEEFIVGLIGKRWLQKQYGISNGPKIDKILDDLLEKVLPTPKEEVAKKEIKIKKSPEKDWGGESKFNLDKAVTSAGKGNAREVVMQTMEKHYADFMNTIGERLEKLPEKKKVDIKPFKELAEDVEVVTTEAEQAEAKTRIMDSIANMRNLPESKQGANTMLKNYTDEEIYNRLAYVAQNFKDGDGLAGAAFMTAKFVFPDLGTHLEEAKESGAKWAQTMTKKKASGTLGLLAFQTLIEAGFIELDRGFGGRDPNVIAIDNEKLVDNTKLFPAFIQGADPKKIIKHIPKGVQPYFEGEEGSPFWEKNNEDGIPMISGKVLPEALNRTTNGGKTKKVFTQANKASEPFIKYNDHMVAVYSNLLNKPAFTFKDKALPESIRKSKARKAFNSIRYAVEVVGDKAYQQRTQYELRGRMRSALRENSHQSDKMVLSFTEIRDGSQIEETGMQDLMIQAADTSGFKGQDFDERLQHTAEMFDTWMEWASDPIKHYDKIFKLKDGWLFFTTINALHDAMAWSKENGRPVTEHVSTALVGYDQTASGPSLIGTMVKDHDNETTFNLGDTQEKGDPYTEVGREFFLNAQKGTWSEADVQESLDVAKKISDIEIKLDKGKMKKEDFQALVNERKEIINKLGKARFADLKDAFFSRPELKDNFERQFGKVLGRSKYYGGKVMGLKEALKQEFLPEKDYFPGFPDAWALAAAKELNDAADVKLKRNTQYMNSMGEMGADLIEEGMELNGPVNGFIAISQPKKTTEGRIKEKNYRGKNSRISKKLSIDYIEQTEEGDKAAARTKGSSFVTHFTDAQLNAWVVLNFGHEALYIFDNFLTTPGYSRELLNKISEGYIEIFGKDYLKDLVNQIYETAGRPVEDAQRILDMIDFGQLDMSSMKEISHHLMAAGNGLERATPFPGEIQEVLENNEATEAINEANSLTVENKVNEMEERSKNCK